MFQVLIELVGIEMCFIIKRTNLGVQVSEIFSETVMLALHLIFKVSSDVFLFKCTQGIKITYKLLDLPTQHVK